MGKSYFWFSNTIKLFQALSSVKSFSRLLSLVVLLGGALCKVHPSSQPYSATSSSISSNHYTPRGYSNNRGSASNRGRNLRGRGTFSQRGRGGFSYNNPNPNTDRLLEQNLSYSSGNRDDRISQQISISDICRRSACRDLIDKHPHNRCPYASRTRDFP